MSTPTISVIIPVYNTESYLHRCINSILNQNYEDWELLLIDDGSTDKSPQICDDYAKQNARIRVFHEKNAGVSSARNLGLCEAKGKRIVFVDSDDYVTPEYLADFSLDADISLQGYYDERGKERKYVECFISNDVGGQYFHQRHIYGPVCKMFKKEIVDEYHICFDQELSLGEDFLFVMQYLLRCQTMHVSSGCNYYYDYSNTTSLSKRSKTLEESLDMFKKHIAGRERLLIGSPCYKGIMQQAVWDMLIHFRDNYDLDIKTIKSDGFLNYVYRKYLTPFDRFMLRWDKTKQLHSHLLYQLRKRKFIKV